MTARILVYGVSGSGKSTAARRIGERTQLPVVDVDDLTWRPGWVLLPEDTQREVFGEILAGERWVLDTAYSSWVEVALDRADLVVGLDYPRWFSLQRLVRRSVMRAIDQQPICHGNTESWRRLLGRGSIVRWHFRSFPRKRANLRRWAADGAGPDGEGPDVLLFGRPRELERWIATLSPGGSRGPGRLWQGDGHE